jgi:uncharacterized protein YqeY
MTSPLRAALQNRLEVAMRTDDRPTTGVKRSVLAALQNAEAVRVEPPDTLVSLSEHVAGAAVGLGAGEAQRHWLSPAEERSVVEREVAELRLSSAAFDEAGRHDKSAELLTAAERVEEVLEAAAQDRRLRAD